MSAVRGVIVGALGLTALEAVVSSQTGTENVSTLIGLVSSAFRRLVDPSVPLIPDLRKAH